MAVTLRLMRFGKKKQPFYRIVSLDKRSKRDGTYIEKIGLYDPLLKSDNITINKERFSYWKSRGATMSDGLTRLVKSTKNIIFE
ncbi:30S ribosomal protein S16 [Candidatus Roizmanbacteria bacterium CG11_big_fil_rev_8_21_14_0_20_36_8]|uniref:Small ribosomal subunit protein bS16 n=2 Tax=Candidatus Roizmaniibacteriota TaxID=1752723 RepID=A0A2M6IVD9_9BACT|nr:MAG: 30S ribosomal protein S16 [Candidatus Roizmanbacteria bacterium CG11_big_fil_rev_8_21_14_0_20_36_8]PIZ66042.1 MAG: 30S ribosomal protein S16 [Candidatus Roizmanbacteria bacterium CG_4_10_14_0_2_um_filter_36_9]